MNSTETFIPYNQNKDYIMVEFVEMKKKEGDAFHNIMVVSYLNEDHELHPLPYPLPGCSFVGKTWLQKSQIGSIQLQRRGIL